MSWFDPSRDARLVMTSSPPAGRQRHRSTTPMMSRAGAGGRLVVGVIVLVGVTSAGASVGVADPGASSQQLTLSTAVERALANHPALAVATARQQEAAEALGEVVAGRGPLVRANVSALHYDDPMVVSPIHGFGPGLFPPFDDTLVQAAVNVSYLLLDGGARRERTRQADANVAVAAAGSSLAAQALIARVAQSFATAQAQNAALTAETARVEALDGERDRVATLIAAGRVAEVEGLRAEAALAAADAARVRAAVRLDLASRELSRLMGGADATDADLAIGELDYAPLLTPPAVEPRASLLARALAASPQLAELRSRVDTADATKALARTAYFPELRAVGALMEYSDGSLNATTDWSAGLQLTIPIWDGGITQRRVAKAGAQRDAARAAVAQAELEVSELVDRALAAWTEATARGSAFARAEERLVEVVRVQKLLLEVGSGTQVDYLSALAELASTRAERSQAAANEVIAQVDLARVTGALTPEWIRQTLEASR